MVESEGASESTAGHQHVGSCDISEHGDPYFEESPFISDTSERKRPRKVVSSFGCLCICMMFLLITAAVIMMTGCDTFRHEYENLVPASCSLTQVQELVNHTTQCQCGYFTDRNNHRWLCVSSYPCYVINVTYIIGNVTGPAMLSSGINSLTPCSIDLLDCYMRPEINRKLVEEQLFVLQETTPAIECVHNKENTRNAYLAKDYEIVAFDSLVDCYFWPALLIALTLFQMLTAGYVAITRVRAHYTYATWRNMQSPTYTTPSGSDDEYDDETQEPASRLARLRKFMMSARCANIFSRPSYGSLLEPTTTTTPSTIIQEIPDKDTEGLVRRARLDEPFVDSSIDSDPATKVMDSDSEFETNERLSLRSLV